MKDQIDRQYQPKQQYLALLLSAPSVLRYEDLFQPDLWPVLLFERPLTSLFVRLQPLDQCLQPLVLYRLDQYQTLFQPD
ncbi:MAG: hypothetical protein CMJ17_09975 [Phenylobacterium sp.]|nr:hypothetical protein [Phenylobacterium sp.]